MIQVDELKRIFSKNGKSQKEIAEMLGISSKTFYSKMDKGVFNSTEIQIMIDNLHIENPIDIFFAESDIKSMQKRELSRLFDSLDERLRHLVLVHVRSLAGKNIRTGL